MQDSFIVNTLTFCLLFYNYQYNINIMSYYTVTVYIQYSLSHLYFHCELNI